MPQPCGVTNAEAASLPYTALTAYSALWYTGGLCWKDAKRMKILILGASGGVGVCAVQMLRAVGATVSYCDLKKYIFTDCGHYRTILYASINI